MVSKTASLAHTKPTFSPWEEIQTCKTLAPGVFWVTTAGHGGLMVHCDVRELSEAARERSLVFGPWFCFEEDCLCSVAFYEHPAWWRTHRELQGNPISKTDDECREYFRRDIERWEPEYFQNR